MVAGKLSFTQTEFRVREDGINNSITILPSSTYLNQNCYYSIDQVLID